MEPQVRSAEGQEGGLYLLSSRLLWLCRLVQKWNWQESIDWSLTFMLYTLHICTRCTITYKEGMCCFKVRENVMFFVFARVRTPSSLSQWHDQMHTVFFLWWWGTYLISTGDENFPDGSLVYKSLVLGGWKSRHVGHFTWPLLKHPGTASWKTCSNDEEISILVIREPQVTTSFS